MVCNYEGIAIGGRRHGHHGRLGSWRLAEQGSLALRSGRDPENGFGASGVSAGRDER